MIRKNLIQVQKTARFFTIGTLGEETKEIWFVCHGYGQLAEYFLRKFQQFEDGKTFVIAPEALNHFYVEGFSGRVGATWMTKEERDAEITDYVSYFDGLSGQLFGNIDFEKVKLNVLGFSQGVAAVCRWVVLRNVPFHRLILWAGIFPPDLNSDFSFSINALKEKEVIIVYGDKDPMLKEAHLKEMESFRQIKPDLQIVRFEGGHELKEDVLLKLKG
jgi:predicted esterase